MTIDRNVWKTGALAVAATLIFALLVFKTEQWSTVLMGKGPAYAQTGLRSASEFDVTRIIPHIAVGSLDGNITRYTTTIQIVNPGNTAVAVKGNFYNPDGSPSDLTYTTTATTAPTIKAGILDELSLDPNSSLIISGALPTTTAGYKGNWGKVHATGPILITTLFEVRDPAATKLYSRAGVAASPIMSKFAIPRVRNVTAGLDVAFAIVNVGTATANVTATLRDAAGVSVVTKTLVLAPGAQSAQVLWQFFNVPESRLTTFYSFVAFDGGPSAQLGAVAIAYEGSAQTTFPVEPLP